MSRLCDWLIFSLCAWVLILPMDAPSLFVGLGLLFLLRNSPKGWFELLDHGFGLQKGLIWASLLYLSVTFLQVLGSNLLFRGLEEWFRIALLWFLFLRLEGRMGRLQPLLILLLRLVAGLSFLIIFFQVFLDTGEQPLSWALTSGQEPLLPRGYGQFLDPNVCGAYLVLHLFLVLRLSLSSAEAWMSVAGILLTQSRGAFLGLCVLLGFYFLFSHRRRLCVGLLLVSIVGFIGIGRASTLVPRDLGVNQRLELLRGGARMFAARPFLGHGPGSFHRYYPAYRTVGGYYPAYAHNHPLEILIEQGLLGLFLWLFCAGLFLLWVWHRDPRWLAAFAAMGTMSLVGHVYSMFAYKFHLLLVLLVTLPPRPTRDSQKVPVYQGLLVFMALFMVAEIARIHFQFQNQRPPKALGTLRYDFSLAQSLLESSQDNLQDPAWGEYLDVLLHLDEQESEFLYWKGRRAEQREKPYLAAHFYDRALMRNPHAERYLWHRMRLALKLHQNQRYQELLEFSMQSNPDYLRVNPWYDDIRRLEMMRLFQTEGIESANQYLRSQPWVDSLRALELLKRLAEMEDER